ncbi:MAG: transketolase [Spirochaetes bacterium]|nr:transketolase [Spirochaetota bacterium]
MKISNDKLKEIAKELRKKILTMLMGAKSGHPGGSLSGVEIILTLFYKFIERTKENADKPDRHFFILSKGHGVPTLYAVLSSLGLIEEDELYTLRKLGSRIQGHPDRVVMPYVEASTGSLGQGLSTAQGVAMAQKLNKYPSYTYCLIGDGETEEGQIWEVFLSAPKFKLDNLIVFLDYNKAQIDGLVKDVMDLEPLKDKLTAFKWHVQEIDGHDIDAIEKAVKKAQDTKGKPSIIIAHTLKGKGCFMEKDLVKWHGVAPTEKECAQAIEELA